MYLMISKLPQTASKYLAFETVPAETVAHSGTASCFYNAHNMSNIQKYFHCIQRKNNLQCANKQVFVKTTGSSTPFYKISVFFGGTEKLDIFAAQSKGEMAEWSNAAVLKTVDLKGSRGSNPFLSANQTKFKLCTAQLFWFKPPHQGSPTAGR